MSETHFINQKKFKKVDRIEPKRAFIISQLIRNMDRGNTRYLSKLSNKELEKRLEKAKKIVLRFTEKQLDSLIQKDAPRYKKRLKYYNLVDWYKGVVDMDEVGIWHGAGGLPNFWTQGSLEETSRFVQQTLKDGEDKRVAARAKRALFGISDNLNIIENEEYLYPIILPGATNGRGIDGKPRKNFNIMKGDIDDGCMRAIAFVINGKSSFNAYIGINPSEY